MSSQYQLLYNPETHEVTYGTVGSQGFQGLSNQGVQGSQGQSAVGLQGAQGAQGVQGDVGVQGYQGVQGIQGLQGVQGLQGLQGFQGEQGIQGLQGYQGVQGFQGLQGFQGTQGFQGFQGFQGLQGYQGFQGEQGLQGFQGSQGIDGVFPTDVQNIAIGVGAGLTGQSADAIAIGYNAGNFAQGAYSIALGYQAGLTGQSSNSIVLNASGAALNAGTTGLFINPIRYRSGPVFSAGMQGFQGFQGTQGFQGLQGYQGTQGFQGLVGQMGSVAGTQNQIQYNAGGSLFGASNNLVFNTTTNQFTFGSGNTGGSFQVIGSMFQGVTSGTPIGTDTPGGAKLAYRNNGSCVEFATVSGTSVVDFHSNDNSGVDFDSRIASQSGTGSAGGGNLLIQAGAFNFSGTTSNITIPSALIFGTGSLRAFAVNQYVITASVANGASTNVYSPPYGGSFNIICNNTQGNGREWQGWLVKNGPSSWTWVQVATNAQGALVTITFGTSPPSITVNNNLGSGNTVYVTIEYLANPNIV